MVHALTYLTVYSGFDANLSFDEEFHWKRVLILASIISLIRSARVGMRYEMFIVGEFLPNFY